ncbi:12-(S)-hydroxy-5,8,10,14-eicosatetraenoic acid receptor-like [Neoarius graeffei]|uniref:12-(S)-hydroxy-5,8,10,14-eicosatetraenoic acid receptor-like n=1 Tax=Neoarius graeffei TaxID=443677 RepID=UPI00298CA822|nr:12-(S)-hydroxy-5,8,10,14-eicosatetraenoic acid receptor-like [Neoarius graeffei]
MAFHASDDCTARSKDLYTFYSSVMIVELILALPLNLTVLYLFIFKLKFWKAKNHSIFLFNLVLADILLLICLPVRAYYFLRGERRSDNDVVCKSVLFMLFLNRGASIVFLTIISIDRYFSVVHPKMKNPFKTQKQSILICVLVWILLLPLTIPSMLTTFECCDSNKTDGNTADNTTNDIFRELTFFTPVLIPSIILVYCTIKITKRLKEQTIGNRTKLRRAVFLVTLVILVFSFCFWPSAISRLVLLMVRIKALPRAEEIAVQVYDGLMCLSYLDCLLDPIVYCLSSTKFKQLYISTYLPFLMKGQGAEHH